MFEIFLVTVLGLIIGSYVAALTWRMPRGIKISKGRSICPNCRKKISWFDNIPVISFFLLRGRCRSCKKKISFRYPLIELSASLVFVSLFLKFGLTIDLLYLYFLSICLISVFIVDLEEMLIPDEFVFAGLVTTVVYLLLLNPQNLFPYLLSGFAASLFFLLIYFLTKGKGMGLGDVKLALLLGLVLGSRLTIQALFFAFVIGAIVGIIMLIFGKAHLKKPIAFGPFMIIGFYLSLFLSNIVYLL